MRPIIEKSLLTTIITVFVTLLTTSCGPISTSPPDKISLLGELISVGEGTNLTIIAQYKPIVPNDFANTAHFCARTKNGGIEPSNIFGNDIITSIFIVSSPPRSIPSDLIIIELSNCP